MSSTEPISIDQGQGYLSEPMPSLSDIAKEVGGAWPKGWYQAEIIAGYQAKSFTFSTDDTPSRNGDSRNVRLALRLSSPTSKVDGEHSVEAGASRNTFYQQNYRLTDLTAANVQRVKDGNADTRLRIALSSLGQIEKAIGMSFRKHPEGYLMPGAFVGQKVDVRLNINEDGYNDVTAFAALGSKTGGAKNGHAK